MEVAQNVLVDVDGRYVRLFPTDPIHTWGEAEKGLLLHEEAGKQVLRRDGRTIETFRNAQDAAWWLEERGFEAAKAAA